MLLSLLKGKRGIPDTDYVDVNVSGGKNVVTRKYKTSGSKEEIERWVGRLTSQLEKAGIIDYKIVYVKGGARIEAIEEIKK